MNPRMTGPDMAPETASKPLTLGVSTGALFDMRESDWVFRNRGMGYYEDYMHEREDEPFAPGLLFESAILHAQISQACGHDLVRIALMSRNDGWTGIRAVKSCEHYGIPFQNAVFMAGRSPVPYLHAYGVDQFVSCRADDVEAALNTMGVAAYQAFGVLPAAFDESALEKTFAMAAMPAAVPAPAYTLAPDFKRRLHLVFDLDRVVFDHGADIHFDPARVEDYIRRERELAALPLEDGPLAHVARTFSTLARHFARDNTPYVVSVLTARAGGATLRAMQSLRSMGIHINGEFHLVGGSVMQGGRAVPVNPDKSKVLRVMRALYPDDVIEFYDDSTSTIGVTGKLHGVLSGLVPRQSGTGSTSIADALAAKTHRPQNP